MVSESSCFQRMDCLIFHFKKKSARGLKFGSACLLPRGIDPTQKSAQVEEYIEDVVLNFTPSKH